MVAQRDIGGPVRRAEAATAAHRPAGQIHQCGCARPASEGENQ